MVGHIRITVPRFRNAAGGRGALFWLGFGMAAMSVAILSLPSTVLAISPEDRWRYYRQDINFMDDPCGVNVGGSTVNVDDAKAANIGAIIGIAKTYDMGQRGALIGLMTAITESHIQNYANSGIPVSKQNPDWLALPQPRPLGNDHDSVGIMQQRVSTGWSTFGNGPSQEVTWQLMDPAYAAQAFFGSPPGSKLPAGLKQPSALRKGVLNKPNWQTRDPGEVAQSVQVSAFPDRYNQHRAEAQALIDKYWDSSPAITLPISITAGSTDDLEGILVPLGADCEQTGAVGDGSLAQKILDYAWPTFHKAPYLIMKPEYKKAIDAARSRKEYVGGGIHPGIDCGGYVTRLMRDSGTDPQYNKYQGNTFYQKKYMDDNPSKYKKLSVGSTKDLQFGDIAIIGNQHTFMYVGPGKVPGFTGSSTSASITTWRTPMADGTPIRGYNWYRPLMLAPSSTMPI